ncbi:GreA/GreB family elongation factor [Patescibacteria group bacterium]|nr:GreA/GreB family elongation factor [Patescibacteria group bacterium]
MIGTCVTVQFEDDGKPETYILGTHWDTEKSRSRQEKPPTISLTTPIVQALRSKREGDDITLPHTKARLIKIEKS